jgi:hypothetical protein
MSQELDHAKCTPPNLPDSVRMGDAETASGCRSACPVCGGVLAEIRHKLHCTRCHAIVETCCEGGRG